VVSSMRRSDQPSPPSARICCCRCSSKTSLMTATEPSAPPVVNVSVATRGGRFSGVDRWPVLGVYRGFSASLRLERPACSTPWCMDTPRSGFRKTNDGCGRCAKPLLCRWQALCGFASTLWARSVRPQVRQRPHPSLINRTDTVRCTRESRALSVADRDLGQG
jgi:hypothetical protein